MNRRTFLAALSIIISNAITGCLSTSETVVGLRLKKATDPMDTIEVIPYSTLRDDQLSLLNSAVQSNDQTVSAYGYEPFKREGAYVRDGNTFYKVKTTRGGTSKVRKPVLIIEPLEQPTDVVPLERYSNHAMEIILSALEQGEISSKILQPNMAGFKDIVPEPKYREVSWKNDQYRLSVRNRLVEQSIYNIRAEIIAESSEDFQEYIYQNKLSTVLRPSELSPEKVRILEEAVKKKYEETSPIKEEFDELLNTIRSNDPIKATWKEIYLIRYDLEIYKTEIWKIEGN